MRLSDFIEQCNRAASSQVVLDLMERAAADLGFDRFAYCALTSYHRYANAEAPAPAIALNYPSSWTDFYFDHEYQNVDPVVLHAPEFEKPFLWDTLDQTVRLDAAQQAIMHEAEEAGLKDGVGVPLHGPRGDVCLITFAGDAPHPNPGAALSSLAVLATQFHTAYREIECNDAHSLIVPVLSDRERECLLWVARGKSTWDISAILGISENTVKFHIKNTFSKLDTRSRIAAVVKAIRYGLISP